MKRLLFVLAIVSALAFTIAGQGTTGTLSGTVSGPDGVLPGATVVVRDTTTGRELTTTTNEQGFYQFSQLEFGIYTIRITSTGFKTLVANEQKIDVGRSANFSPTLEIGEVTAEVVVTAGADVITSNTAQVSSTVSPQQILSLPLLTRNPLALTGLQAGVASNSSQNTTINGMRTTFTNITRDGVNIQDAFIRTNATDFAPGRPSVDDTGEFTISLANQEADQGYGGAQIRLVTPRGTKDFHGALFAYNRNSAFAANSFFNNRNSNPAINEKPSFRNRNQYGGKGSWRLPVPGFGEGVSPILWDKAFWFVAFEGIKDPVSSAATRTILSPSAQDGTFTYTRTTAGSAINTNVNGANVQCAAAAGSTCTITNFLNFAQSVFPAGNIRSSISPTVQGYLNTLPTASNFTGGDGLNTQGYRFLRGSDQERDQISTRVDVDFDEKNALRGIFSWNEEVNLRPDVDSTGFDTTPSVIQSSTNKQFTMGYRRVFSSNFIGDFQGGLFSSEVPFDRLDSPSEIFAFPLVTSPLGFLDQGRNTKSFNYQANMDWILGNHTLRFGGQLQMFKVNAYNDASILPVISFGSGIGTTFTAPNFTPYGGINTTQLGTANGLLGLLGGHVTQVAQSFNAASISEGFVRGATEFRPFRYENHALYFADRWQAMPGLTLSLGVRYEVYPALRNLAGTALEPIIPDGQDLRATILNSVGGYQPIGGNAGRDFAYYKTDLNNFAPNLGVAWTPNFESGIGRFLFGDSKTVLRAGYSHVFGNDSIVTSINNAAVGNAGLGRTAGPTQSGLNLRVDTDTIPLVPTPAAPTFPRTYLDNNGPGVGNFFGTIFAVDPDIQTPMVKQYSFGMQREIWGNMAFEIRYVGSRSNNLGRGVDYNQLDIFKNGFLDDFLRAQANFDLTGNAFCVSDGCQALKIFKSGGAGSAGRLAVGGTTGLTLSTFNNALLNGTPADLAVSFINSASTTTGGLNNLNNQPCSGVQRNSAGSVIYTCSANATPFINFLPNNSTGVVDAFINGAKYRYDSLQTEIRKRFSQGLYFQVNYTYSKNLTDGVGTSQALFEPFFDNERPEIDWQRADFDTTHVFNFNGIYQLPFGQGKRFLNYGGGWDKLFGGWELSGLGQWQSGAPITFVDTRGTFNRSGRSARQTPLSSLSHDEIQGLVGIFQQNVNGVDRLYWINPSIINGNGQASAGYGTSTFDGQVFFNTEPGQTGNIGRAVIDGPNYFNVNMALLKNIRFNESMRLQLRMEAFNVLNNVNFVQNTQFSNINSTTFGQITSAFGPRELQFAVRFEW